MRSSRRESQSGPHEAESFFRGVHLVARDYIRGRPVRWIRIEIRPDRDSAFHRLYAYIESVHQKKRPPGQVLRCCLDSEATGFPRNEADVVVRIEHWQHALPRLLLMKLQVGHQRNRVRWIVECDFEQSILALDVRVYRNLQRRLWQVP